VRPAPRPAIAESREPAWLWDMTRYQWLVFLAAWLGWGFDVFDGLLFNFVAPVCVPRLLGVPAGDPRVTAATGAITSTLLVGWATGGILFGFVTDWLGRSCTLLLSMLTYAGATAACALAPDVWVLAAFRFVAALGIGGEWAAGASLVAEIVPEQRRVAMGALLYTSAPACTEPAIRPHRVEAKWSVIGSGATSGAHVASCVGPGILTVTQYKVFNNSGALLSF